MNNIGETLILSSKQRIKVTESLHGCKNCFFNSSSGCKKSSYLPSEYECKGELREDNKNIIYKRIK